MPEATPPQTRQAIEDAVRAGDRSRASIAREYGVAPATVSNIARAAGIEHPFARTQTKNATRAREDDARGLRASLALDLLGDAQRLRERAWDTYTVAMPTQGGPSTITLGLPPLREQQSAYTAIAICIDKAAALVRQDDDAGAAAGRTMLNDLFGALRLAHHRIVTEDDSGAVP